MIRDRLAKAPLKDCSKFATLKSRRESGQVVYCFKPERRQSPEPAMALFSMVISLKSLQRG